MSTTQGSDSEYQCTWLSRTRFNELLEEYRESATPERRGKIFINQEMYNDIKGVLEVWFTLLVFYHYLLTLIILQKGTRYNRQRGSKFVSWARKRFKLTSFANNVTIVTLAKDENKTIAIEEQLYKTITKAHEDCQHGGKHATLARVSKLVDRLNVTYIYTWNVYSLPGTYTAPICLYARLSSIASHAQRITLEVAHKQLLEPFMHQHSCILFR